MDGSGVSSRGDRVDDECEVGAHPGVEQAQGLLLAGDDFAPPGIVAEPLGDDEADSVVRAVRVAHSNGDDPHSRSTFRSRKCVAHEMQGS